MPDVIFGGVPIVLHAGPPAQSDSPVLGESLVRLALGSLVKMSHFKKAGGSISGSGWMPPGLDGLDYDHQLELRLTAHESISGVGLVYALTGTPRPDVAPWALALVGDELESASCTLSGSSVTVAPVAGASRYYVQWMPVYTVFANKPVKSVDPATNTWTWQLDWQEV